MTLREAQALGDGRNAHRTGISWRDALSLAILGFVAALFAMKYGARTATAPAVAWTIGAMFAFVPAVMYLVADRFVVRFLPSRRTFIAALVLAVLVVAVGVHVLPEASRVGRLPALREWLDAFLAGRFPYGTPAMPSGLPVLFLLALPFHLAGNLGWLEVITVAAFGVVLLRLDPRDGAGWRPLAVLFVMPPFWYEVFVRSELLFNMVLALALILLAEARLRADRIDGRFILVAALFGLVLSTRIVVALPWAAYAAYRFRRDILRGAAFAGLVLAAFALTLVPFFLWDPAAFLSRGPFAVQGRYLPLPLAAAVLMTVTFLGWRATSLRDVVFAVGIILLAVVAPPFAAATASSGFPDVLFADGFDIGYFILAVPWLVAGIGEERATGTRSLAPGAAHSASADGQGIMYTQ